MVLRDVVVLGFSAQLGKIEVLSMGTRPIGHENAGVCPHQLSIKFDGERKDIDKNVGMEEAMHSQSTSEQRGLGKVFVLCE